MLVFRWWVGLWNLCLLMVVGGWFAGGWGWVCLVWVGV